MNLTYHFETLKETVEKNKLKAYDLKKFKQEFEDNKADERLLMRRIFNK